MDKKIYYVLAWALGTILGGTIFEMLLNKKMGKMEYKIAMAEKSFQSLMQYFAMLQEGNE